MNGRQLVQRFGAWWLLDPNGDQVEQEILNQGVWENVTTQHFAKLVTPGCVLVDVGTHIGWYSVVCGMRGAYVVGIEADPARAYLARAHLAMNHVDGEIEMGLAGPVHRIDSLYLERCDLLKIDTDGYEEMVLDGAEYTLERWHPVVLLEVSDWCLQHNAGVSLAPGACTHRMLKGLERHGYQFFSETDLSLLSVEQVVQRQLSLNSSINVFCATSREALQ